MTNCDTSILCKFLVGAIFLLAIADQLLAEEPGPLRWYKGNTHTHTLNSDGDSTPDEVVRWYREQDYDFLVLTDHNFLTSVEALNALHGADEQFLVIPGEEVTDRFGRKPLHLNALDPKMLVEPQGGESVVDTLQRNVDAIRAADGIPHINHPNFGWAITAEELRSVMRYKLFEIFNGHPSVNNVGGGGRPGLEEIWDTILSTGRQIYGIAVDDAHHFKRPWDRHASQPGQGWVVVRAERLEADAIFDAMERGEFYASTGVELEDYFSDSKRMLITLPERGATRYTVQFIGVGGSVLDTRTERVAEYRFRGNELYVRARVTDSNGKVAWTQPVFP